jgi:2,3-bisphosphoglycerate-independent phosphoglycerate mutase
MIWNPFSKKVKLNNKNNLGVKLVPGGIKPVVLLVLDGWGIAPPSEGNAITTAKTPNMDKFQSTFPHAELIAAGEPVGLPANEEGNSEVGHLIIGAGRVILQSLKRINFSIEEGTFYDNKAFMQVAANVKKYKSKLHLMGLVSTGNVHSSIDHLHALLEFCRKRGITSNLYLHLFTDGRDAPPNEGIKVIKGVEDKIRNLRMGKVATVSGRYYAMDRDRRWQRTQKAYEAIVMGKGNTANSSLDAVQKAYDKNQTDEFIEPTVIIENNSPVATVDDNDAVIFFNFRVDRPKQLTMAFVLPDFENLKSYKFGYDPDHATKEGVVISGPTFKREKKPQNVFFVTMTEYEKNLPVSAIAFPPEKAGISLPSTISENGLKQLHLTESEKERMVTIYFDGLREARFPGEDVLIVPSPKVPTYDKKPEMSVYEIVRELKKALYQNKHHFYILNFANPDMVAHSGSIKATIKAIEHVDKAIGMVADAVLAVDGTLVITADHGNAEELLTYPTASFFFTTSKGDVNTDHSGNPVPLIVVGNKYKSKPTNLGRGTLSDIAPTILHLMQLPVPEQMKGRNLFKVQKPTNNLASELPVPIDGL